MKLTKTYLKKIIKEELLKSLKRKKSLKEGMKDDYKNFQKEVNTT